MKKIFIAAGLLAFLSACSPCWSPINETCTPKNNDHVYKTFIEPEAIAFRQVPVLPSKEAYRPCFTPGEKRVKAVGNGTTMERAMEDAVAKICLENDCDMIVAAKAITVRTTHPRWFGGYTTYQVNLSGIPLTMTSLTKEILKDSGEGEKTTLSKEDIKALILELMQGQSASGGCQPALLNLKDIRLTMTAAADTKSQLSVKMPAKCNGTSNTK